MDTMTVFREGLFCFRAGGTFSKDVNKKWGG